MSLNSSYDLEKYHIDFDWIWESLSRNKYRIATGFVLGSVLSLCLQLVLKGSTYKNYSKLIIDLSSVPQACKQYTAESECNPLIRKNSFTLFIQKRLRFYFSERAIASKFVQLRPLRFVTSKTDENGLEVFAGFDLNNDDESKEKFYSLKSDIEAFINSRISYLKATSPTIQVDSLADTKDWLFIESIKRHDNSFASIVALGGIFGLLVSSLYGLDSDKKSSIVFTQKELLTYLDYPVLLRLPKFPVDDYKLQGLIQSLALQMSADLEWKVLSIACNHPSVHSLASALGCSAASPVLETPLLPLDKTKNLGVVLVVEPGFNTHESLQLAKEYLAKSLVIDCVYLAMMGTAAPKELLLSVANNKISFP